MTKIVGIDFGTTNVRVSHREVGSDTTDSSQIGRGGLNWMPAVIAFRIQPGGTVETLVGEDADILDDAPDVVVVRNIKRYATASDPVVRSVIEWDFDRQGITWPTWFDPDKRLINVWNETVSIEEGMKLILKEAITRSNLVGDVDEWRAGCPVNSDLAYRRALIAALDELGCEGRVDWIVEEPLLLAALGRAIPSLSDGAYMVYDFGGGSFDCAIVEVEGGSLTVYAEEGLPTLGGMDIDEKLKEDLGYTGSMTDLRAAKEQLSKETPRIELAGGLSLEIDDINTVSEAFINPTLAAMLGAYERAKTIWKRPEGTSPYGEYHAQGGLKDRIQSMARDIDKVLVVGGPTLVPCFTERLEEVFGDQSVMTAEDLVLGTPIPDARLTTLSHGACHMRGNRYVPVTVDRVPATVTLIIAGERESKQYTYEAFERMPYRSLLSPHVGSWLDLETERPQTYQVVIESADGEVLNEKHPISEKRPMRMPRDGYLGPLADRARLVIDRLGRVWVTLAAGFKNVPAPLVEDILIDDDPPWQTDVQREVIRRMHEQQRAYERAQAERTHINLTQNPFGHHERPG